MLLYFKTSNNLSFDKEIYFTTVAGKYKNKETGKEDLPHNLIPIEKYDVNLLRSSVIYGANASGKSNLLLAIVRGVDFIKNNYYQSNMVGLWIFDENHNKLNPINSNQPITYTYGFLADNTQFEFNFSLDKERIIEESLLEYRTQKPIEHYSRKYNKRLKNYDWKFSKYFSGEKETVKSITNEKSLYLSVGSVSNLEIPQKVVKWFETKITWILEEDVLDQPDYEYVFSRMDETPAIKQMVLERLKIADFSIVDFVIKNKRGPYQELEVKTIHKTVNEKNEEILIEFDYFKNESLGTKKLVGWLGVWFDVLVKNKIVLIDEFGTSMHTLLTRNLLEDFNATVESNAQLILTTHDTNLMTRELFRPDQIWIVEKDTLGNSSLQALSDFKLSKDKDLEKTYLQGLYGGIPHLKNE